MRHNANQVINKIILVIFICACIERPIFAAGFDCDKANTKIEERICENPELSALDSLLDGLYKYQLFESANKGEAIKSQRQWLKDKRNTCSNDKCLKDIYLKRITEVSIATKKSKDKSFNAILKQSNKERYIKKFEKDAELCDLFLGKFNGLLDKYGNDGDEHHDEISEIGSIDWTSVQISNQYNGEANYTEAEWAALDIKNNGVEKYVLRIRGSLSGGRADELYILDVDLSNPPTEISAEVLQASKDVIYLAGGGYHESMEGGELIDLRVLEPFTHNGKIYISMRELFEKYLESSGYLVIAEYGGGKFEKRNQTGIMNDVCYFKRFGPSRKY